MKILRIMPAPSHLHEFRESTGLNESSYAHQIETLRAENFILPGGWAKSMGALGVEVFESLYNDPPLVAKWAEENNATHLLMGPDYFFNIIKEQIKAFKPDVLFLYAGAFFWVNREMRAEIKNKFGRHIVLTGFWGDELPPNTSYKNMFGDLDLVFSSSSVYTQHFETAGIRAITIGNCFDDTILYKKMAAKSQDFIFCGTTGYGYPDHVGRYENLIELMRRTSLRIYSSEHGRAISLKHLIKSKVFKVLAKVPFKIWRVARPFLPARIKPVVNVAMRLRETSLAPEFLYAKSGHRFGTYFVKRKPLKKIFSPSRMKKPLLRGTDYHTLLAEAKIVLNLHRDEDADIGNIRCFEATGVGSCLLTDHGEALSEFFDTENEIVTFSTIEECIQKAQFLLDNPAERERIAKNGQARTLSTHTVAHRCKVIVDELRNYSQKVALKKTTSLVATYDLDKHPISFDISFFLQAAEIRRKLLGADSLVIKIINPRDIENQPGISKEVDSVVDSRARLFRVFHICTQMSEMLPNSAAINIKDRKVSVDMKMVDEIVIDYPGEDVGHHSEYYRQVNSNPSLMSGFEASVEAHRFIERWLTTFLCGRRLICVTLRQYHVDQKRNSNVAAWTEFLATLDSEEYAVVVLPDTDHIADFRKSSLGIYQTFEPACFDVDLRFALYERAYLNMFVNNGPAVAATLSKKIRYLLFKIVEPSVPHCSEEFLAWCGFKPRQTPEYASKYQKWVWENDDVNILSREFDDMDRMIQADQF